MQQIYLTIQAPLGMLLAISSVTIFWMQLLLSLFVCIVALVWYVWPSLVKLPLNSALAALLFVHVFRYLGMTLLVPYMYDQRLPSEYLNGSAYGDLLAAVLAMASIFALRYKWRVAIPLVWVFSLWGFGDLLNGLRSVFQVNLPKFNLATIWYIYTFYAPLVILSHLMIFWILIKSKSWNK
jgi:hypothetical protein